VSRAIGSLAAVLFFGAAASFVVGIIGLVVEHDAQALYWLLLGGVGLKCSADLVHGRPS
jgi:hypothetical protein